MVTTRKVLLGSATLGALGPSIGVAHAGDGQITLSVNGYYNNWVTFVSQDEDGTENNIGEGNNGTVALSDRNFNPVRFRHEGEIHFVGSTTLDNGLQVGFQAQLEAITQGDQLDETYLFFEGSWGRLVMGAENSAAFLMQYTAPNVGIPGVNSPSFMFSLCCRGTTSTLFTPSFASPIVAAMGGLGNFAPTATLILTSSDAEKITYFTPRFSGFQFGASYTPDLSNTTGITRGSGLDTTGNAGLFNHALAAGVNFVDRFGTVDLAIAAGMEWANLQDSAPQSPLPAGFLADDIVNDDQTAFSAGFNVGFSGLVVGGSFLYIDSLNGVDGLDAWAMDAGASYGFGPWSVSANYYYSQAQMDDRDYSFRQVTTPFGFGEKDRYHLADLSITYALGPGVWLSGSVQYFNEKTRIVAWDEAEGIGLSIGTSLYF